MFLYNFYLLLFHYYTFDFNYYCHSVITNSCCHRNRFEVDIHPATSRQLFFTCAPAFRFLSLKPVKKFKVACILVYDINFWRKLNEWSSTRKGSLWVTFLQSFLRTFYFYSSFFTCIDPRNKRQVEEKTFLFFSKGEKVRRVKTCKGMKST